MWNNAAVNQLREKRKENDALLSIAVCARRYFLLFLYYENVVQGLLMAFCLCSLPQRCSWNNLLDSAPVNCKWRKMRF